MLPPKWNYEISKKRSNVFGKPFNSIFIVPRNTSSHQTESGKVIFIAKDIGKHTEILAVYEQQYSLHIPTK